MGGRYCVWIILEPGLGFFLLERVLLCVVEE